MSWHNADKHLFNQDSINTNAVYGQGVYYLYQGGDCTYIGSSTESVKDRLLDHLNGREGSCTQAATLFGSEYSYVPRTKERSELEDYRSKKGKLPKCNDRMP